MLIDELPAVERVLDRRVVSDLVGGVGGVGGGWRVEAPASVVVEVKGEGGGGDGKGGVQVHLPFPVICKPLPACGSPSSHTFHLLFSPLHLPLLPPSTYLVQRLIPHHTLYKVYVLGSSSHVIPRPSLPPHLTRPSSSRPPLTLNSQTMQVRVMEGGEGVGQDGWEEGEGEGGLRAMVEGAQKAVERVSQRLGDVFGLTLFGYDVIVPDGEGEGGEEEGGGRLVVVDVNYFPSYNQVEGLSGRLLDVIRGKWQRETGRRAAASAAAAAPQPHSSQA